MEKEADTFDNDFKLPEEFQKYIAENKMNMEEVKAEFLVDFKSSVLPAIKEIRAKKSITCLTKRNVEPTLVPHEDGFILQNMLEIVKGENETVLLEAEIRTRRLHNPAVSLKKSSTIGEDYKINLFLEGGIEHSQITSLEAADIFAYQNLPNLGILFNIFF